MIVNYTKILISIILPVYNSELTILRCLNSFCKQLTITDELIIIDDGSTDRSSNIILDYLKNNNKNIFFIQKSNGGVSSARNLGILKSRGKFITFIDSDDYVSENYLDTIRLNLNSELIIFDSFNNFPSNKQLFKKFSGVNLSLNSKNSILLNQLLSFNIINPIWNKIYSKSVISKYNILFDTSLRNGEDLVFNLNYILRINQFIIINQKIYYYDNTLPNSLSKQRSESLFFNQLSLSKQVIHFFSSINVDLTSNTGVFLLNNLLYSLLFLFPIPNDTNRINTLKNFKINFEDHHFLVLLKKYYLYSFFSILVYLSKKIFGITFVFNFYSIFAKFYHKRKSRRL